MASTIIHVGVHEAKTQLSRLLRRVEQGDEIVITRDAKPVARLVPEARGTSISDSFGIFRGQFELRDDFDADSNELGDQFSIPH